jgi:uncharacterized membrane protein HdeD (DUF308 family)
MERIGTGGLVLGLILLAAGVLQGRYRFFKDRRRGRRFYWTTSILGILCFLLDVDKVWPNALIVALLLGAMVVGSAYLITPYLKIGDRIYASNEKDREPDPPDEDR